MGSDPNVGVEPTASRLAISDDIEDLAEAAAAAPESAARARSNRRKPGRPIGSESFRASVREQEVALQTIEDQLELEPATVNVVQVVDVPSVDEMQSVPSVPLAFFRAASDESTLRLVESCVLQQCLKQQEHEGQVSNNEYNVLADIVQKSARVLTKQSFLDQLEIPKTTFTRKLAQCASALLHCSRIAWSRLLQHVSKRILNGKCEGVLIGRLRKYDESPFTLRIADSGEVLGLGSRRTHQMTDAEEAASSRAKLVSSFHRVFMLLRRKIEDDDGSYYYEYQSLTGSCPHRLHVIETTSAMNMKMSQDACIADLPIPDEFSSLFKMRLMLSCTDRHRSNLCAESGLQAEYGNWTFAESHCTLHKAAQAQSAQFQLVDGHVSGMLSAGLAMQAAGTHGQLKSILCQLFRERLVVMRGPPQLQEHRDSLYELLLPLKGDRKLQYQKQRFILRALFNGNVQDNTRVIHMTSDPTCTREDVLELFCTFGVWALLGGSPAPFFNRSKWLGGEVAVSWNAVLCSHHGLHKLLFQRWAGNVQEVPSTVADQRKQNKPGWSGVAARVSSARRLKANPGCSACPRRGCTGAT